MPPAQDEGSERPVTTKTTFGYMHDLRNLIEHFAMSAPLGFPLAKIR